jgi:hypothetical protein
MWVYTNQLIYGGRNEEDAVLIQGLEKPGLWLPGCSFCCDTIQWSPVQVGLKWWEFWLVSEGDCVMVTPMARTWGGGTRPARS